MITGSHHQQIYWYATGQHRLLGQLPGAYLIAEQRWIPRRMAVLHPPGDPVFSETGHWNSTCIACHATHGKPRFDTPFGSRRSRRSSSTRRRPSSASRARRATAGRGARARQSATRCAGIALHLAGARPTPITSCSRRVWIRDASSQVCGQCHGIWEFSTPRASAWPTPRAAVPSRRRAGRHALRRAADRERRLAGDAALLADDSGFIRDSFWSDGKVRVSGREYNGLIESPCFVNATDAARTLSCFSCHTMHKTADDPRPLREWANDQLGAGMDGNGACTQCHAPIARERDRAHQAPRRFDRQRLLQLPHAVHDLRAAEDDPQPHGEQPVGARERGTGRPNACNLCHLDKTLAWTADALNQWYGQAPPPLDADQEQCRGIGAVAAQRRRRSARDRRPGDGAGRRRSRRRAPAGWRRTWRSCSTTRTTRCASAPDAPCAACRASSRWRSTSCQGHGAGGKCSSASCANGTPSAAAC